MALGVAMGIISYCYYDEGVISKKFQFVLNQILGSRDLFPSAKAIESFTSHSVTEEARRVSESGSSKSHNSSNPEKVTVKEDEELSSKIEACKEEAGKDETEISAQK